MLKLYLQGKQFNKYCLTTNSFKHKEMSGGSVILGYALLCYTCSDIGPLSLWLKSKTSYVTTNKYWWPILTWIPKGVLETRLKKL